MTDDTGAIVWQASYSAFGITTIREGRQGLNTFGHSGKPLNDQYQNNLRFQGQQYDEETGLHYNRHRYYDPSQGRYLSLDPIGLAGGDNLYAYVGGNPISRFDPVGLYSYYMQICWGFCIGGGFGYDVKTGEIAITGNVGAGVGGGASLNISPEGNGRPGKPNECGKSGITLGAYSKAGFGIRAPLGGFGVGGKVSGGNDFGANKHYGGLEPEFDFNPATPKFGNGFELSGGFEGSVYFNPFK